MIIVHGNLIGSRDGSYNVTIPAGETDVLFKIPIIDDRVIDNNKIFHVIIDNTSLPHYVFTGSINSTTVTIVDDDGKSHGNQLK